MKHACAAVALTSAALAVNPALAQQQVVKPPISQYAVDIGTRNMSIPGMGGGLAGMMMPAGVGGPSKELWLGLRSSQKAPSPAADHDIPAGMSMGPALPLLAPAPTQRGPRQEYLDEERPPEKPKARMLVYWGCGDAVRPGQPKIADTEKMSLEQFGEALRGRTPPDRGAYRDAQLRWPNEREPKTVPSNASIRGDQLVHGSATPDIKFAIGERQDFLAPVELAVTGGAPGPFSVTWKPVPFAQGYFLHAIGHRQATGEMIIWSSSEVQDTGWGLMTWLPNDFLRKMIAEKVVFPPETTNCKVPAGIFDGVEGTMVQAIAYGEELNLVHPPRPTDPKMPWEQVWTVRVRVKSTGMTMLGMGDDDERQRRPRGDSSGSQAAGRTGTTGATAPAPENKSGSPLDDASDAINKLKGLFKF